MMLFSHLFAAEGIVYISPIGMNNTDDGLISKQLNQLISHLAYLRMLPIERSNETLGLKCDRCSNKN